MITKMYRKCHFGLKKFEGCGYAVENSFGEKKNGKINRKSKKNPGNHVKIAGSVFAVL